MTQMVRTLPGTQETQVRLLGQEGHLEKELATHSSVLVWRILWTGAWWAAWGRRFRRQRRKGRIHPLAAEFQRTARGDKKAFLSDPCKEIGENNTMGKTRDLFRKIRTTKGTSHTKMSTIKDRNSMDPTEAEDIKKRWQEHTEELYKKDLHDPDNHNGVITHLEPDILELKSSGR